VLTFRGRKRWNWRLLGSSTINPEPRARKEAVIATAADTIVRGTSNQKGMPVESASTKNVRTLLPMIHTPDEMHVPSTTKRISNKETIRRIPSAKQSIPPFSESFLWCTFDIPIYSVLAGRTSRSSTGSWCVLLARRCTRKKRRYKDYIPSGGAISDRRGQQAVPLPSAAQEMSIKPSRIGLCIWSPPNQIRQQILDSSISV